MSSSTSSPTAAAPAAPGGRAIIAKDIKVRNEDGTVVVAWADGHTSVIPITRLRAYCPCAVCQGHGSAVVTKIDNTCKAIFAADLVGRYAIHFKFADAHDTGIFRWDTLRKLDPAEVERWGPPEESLRERG
jgi:DUF971 family protein